MHVSDAKKQHSNFFLMQLYKERGLSDPSTGSFKGQTGVFKINRCPTWGTATRNNPSIVLSKWTQTQ